jgi:hypothetical protein
MYLGVVHPVLGFVRLRRLGNVNTPLVFSRDNPGMTSSPVRTRVITVGSGRVAQRRTGAGFTAWVAAVAVLGVRHFAAGLGRPLNQNLPSRLRLA